jgi:glycosyltransferase involved in cell wall biosynthesis
MLKLYLNDQKGDEASKAGAAASGQDSRPAPHGLVGTPSLRLAIFLPTLGGGGAERVMLNLARAFVEGGHKVDLVVANAHGTYQGILSPGVRLIAFDVRRTWRALLPLARYLRREPPDRMFTAMEDAGALALCARLLAGRRMPIVCGIHNTLSKQLAGGSGWRFRFWLALSRLAYPWAEAVVAVSEGAAADARAVLGLRPERVTVIANPVLTPDLAAWAAETIDHPWFAPDAPPVILACGRLSAQKDYPTLLRAFAKLRGGDRAARLLILGEGEERAPLRRLAKELGIAADVDMPGFTANPYAFMARCAVYVLSSRYEGSPVVLVEALACGCRVVATDCPSGPAETLAGVPGAALVPVGDFAALAGAIKAFLASDAPRPGPRLLPRFDYHAAAAAYLAVAGR